MKRTPDLIEGPEALTRFTDAVKKIMSVPRAEIIRREAEYKKRADLNPRKRGPKSKKAN